MNKFVNRHTPEEWKVMAIEAIKNHKDPFETTEEMIENFNRNNSFDGGVITHSLNQPTKEYIDTPIIKFYSKWETETDFPYISYFYYDEESDSLLYRNTSCSDVGWILKDFDNWSDIIYKGKNLKEWIEYDGEEIDGNVVQACEGELVIYLDIDIKPAYCPVTKVEFF